MQNLDNVSIGGAQFVMNKTDAHNGLHAWTSFKKKNVEALL